MAVDQKQFELDRIQNMVRSFGWSVVSTEMGDNKVSVKIEKVMKDITTNERQFELDRIQNMVRSFGWSVVSTEMGTDKAGVKIEKIVVVENKNKINQLMTATNR